MPLHRVNPDNYQQQLATKVEKIRRQFDLAQLDIFPSQVLHYRMRAEFKLWHEGDESYFVMFPPGQPQSPYRVDDFPIGSQRINQLMHSILEQIHQHPLLRHKLFQLEFLTTLSGEALVTLIYHKKLDQHWSKLAAQLSVSLSAQIIGRSKKQKLLIDKDYVTEQLTVNGRSYQYRQHEGSFTQPNAGINQKMLGWALQHSEDFGGDLLELYCGNGNFTAVLASNFQQVLATEISKTAVKSALHNFTVNHIDNVRIVRMSSEEFSSALAGVRKFRRLEGIDLDGYQFSTVLVDPPRAGLDPLTEQWVSRFDNIIYISCNPETLHNNLQQLGQTHRIERFAVFDQFPYTDHIECGVILKRKTKDIA